MMPIIVIHSGGMLLSRAKSSDEKKNGNNVLELENKYKKWQGEDKVDFTLMKTCYLTTLKGRWHRR
jgi:hypothetical protein